jgi:hypothetical protein
MARHFMIILSVRAYHARSAMRAFHQHELRQEPAGRAQTKENGLEGLIGNSVDRDGDFTAARARPPGPVTWRRRAGARVGRGWCTAYGQTEYADCAGTKDRTETVERPHLRRRKMNPPFGYNCLRGKKQRLPSQGWIKRKRGSSPWPAAEPLLRGLAIAVCFTARETAHFLLVIVRMNLIDS